jgi:hypothetical protein
MDDVSILPRDALDNEHRANFTKPWLMHFPNGTVEQFDTEGEACEAQLGWREAHNLHIVTGEPQ